MDNLKFHSLVSFALLSICILFFSELYLFFKGMNEFPVWAKSLPYSLAGGHILSALALFPIVFLTSKLELKSLAKTILLAPLIVLFVIALSLSNGQFFAFVGMNYVWMLLVNILPVSIVLIACRFALKKLTRK